MGEHLSPPELPSSVSPLSNAPWCSSFPSFCSFFRWSGVIVLLLRFILFWCDPMPGITAVFRRACSIAQEAKNTPFSTSHEKFHAVVFKGCQNDS